MKINRFFMAAKNDDTLVLSIYDFIGADFWSGGGITASTVQAALDGDHKSVTVRVNSPGGDAFEGVAIYNLLKSCGKPVNVLVDGLAASAASIICMAGETITMNEGSMMMIHDAQGMAMGNGQDMRKLAETLDQVTGSIADIYVANTGTKKNKVLDMMHAETWMSAQEAKDNGFATAITKGEKVSNSFDLSRFRNVPKEFKEMKIENKQSPECACGCRACYDAECDECAMHTANCGDVENCWGHADGASAKTNDRIGNAAKTKRVDGEDLTSGDFIYAGDPGKPETWALPWHFSTEEKTKSHSTQRTSPF